MERKRKVSSTIIALLMMLVMTACGSSSGSEPTSSQGSTSAGESSGEKAKVLRIAHAASEAYHMHRALVHFKDKVEESGQFKVEIYPSGLFGGDVEGLESAKTGDIDMTVTPSSYYTDEVPEIAFVELPYVFKSSQEAINTLDSAWGDEQKKKFEEKGLYILGFLENGMRHLTNSRREITSPDDLQGLKFRTMPVPAHVYFWGSLGASAEGSPFPELYTNLSTKVFDGQENPVAHIYSSKLFEVQNYMTLTGHCYTTYLGSMNLNYWNSLTSEQQEILATAWDEAYDYQLDLIAQEESVQLDEIANNSNFPTQVTVLTPEQLQAFMDSAKETHDKYKAELGAEEFDKFLKAIEDANK